MNGDDDALDRLAERRRAFAAALRPAFVADEVSSSRAQREVQQILIDAAQRLWDGGYQATGNFLVAYALDPDGEKEGL